MAAFGFVISAGEKEEVRPECDLEINPEMDDGGRWGEKTLRDAGHHRGLNRGKQRIMLISRQKGKYWSDNWKDYCIVKAKLGVEGRVGDDV